MGWCRGLKGQYINGQETEENIKTAFLELIQEKDIDDITISDIAKKACIDRTTFYRHSLSIDDLVTSMTQEMIWEMQSVIMQTRKPAITAFPNVVWWLTTELAETPGREIMQSKYWYKMCEMIELKCVSAQIRMHRRQYPNANLFQPGKPRTRIGFPEQSMRYGDKPEILKKCYSKNRYWVRRIA